MDIGFASFGGHCTPLSSLVSPLAPFFTTFGLCCAYSPLLLPIGSPSTPFIRALFKVVSYVRRSFVSPSVHLPTAVIEYQVLVSFTLSLFFFFFNY